MTTSILIASMLAAPAAPNALLDAVLARDAARVKELLAAGADPNRPRAEKPKPGPFEAALRFGHFMTEGELMMLRARQTQEAHTERPLHAAVWMRQPEMVKLLLAAGADVNAKLTDNGATPLHLAAGARDLSCLRLLLEYRPDLEARDKRGATPLYYAVDTHDPAALAALLEAGAGVNAADDLGETVLRRAAALDAEPALELLLKYKADVDRRNKGDRTALFVAVAARHHDFARRLVAAGARLDLAESESGMTPLHAALRRDPSDLDFVGELVAAGAPLDARDKDGRTPLLASVHWGRAAALRYFLAKGLDPDVCDRAGDSALHTVASASPWAPDTELMLVALLKAGADPHAKNAAGRTPFDLAAEKGAYARAKILAASMKPSPDVDVLKIWTQSNYRLEEYLEAKAALDAGKKPGELTGHDATALVAAVADDNLPLVELLLARGADIHVKHKDGRSLLHLAVERGSWAVAKALLDAGARPTVSANGTSWELTAACERGQVEIAELLLRHGADPDKGDWTSYPAIHRTPMYLAVENGDPALIEVLLAHGADVNGVGGHAKQPALCHALERKRRLIVERLLAHPKIDVHAADAHGKALLHHAAGAGDAALVRRLIDRGAKVNVFERGCYTPLHWAVWGGDAETVRLLLERGAGPNLQGVDRQGRVTGPTPLHGAARSYSPDGLKIVKMLIDQGARTDAVDQHGKRPLDYAVETRREEIAEFLRTDPRGNERKR